MVIILIINDDKTLIEGAVTVISEDQLKMHEDTSIRMTKGQKFLLQNQHIILKIIKIIPVSQQATYNPMLVLV